MSVTRYELTTKYRGNESWDELEENPEGAYVRHGDYAALEQRLIESERYGRQTDITIDNLEMKLAQVWIEGNEPEEFGRYWVRYETDVGPQYCSAKWMEHNFCAGSDSNIHKIWLPDHSRSINSLRGVTHYTKLPDSLEGTTE